ncbi:MAG: serine/threonine-protein phosphatase [Acidobacteria bacterium]|nr:serine/threonine-protein phosphatase [Acidobacteriota bacterium]
MNFIPGNAQHIGSRQQQQDSFGYSNLADAAFRKQAGMLAVVADGMGGMAHGEAAGKCAVKAFLEAYETKAETEPIPDALLRSLLKANAAVYETAVELDAAEEMGTTLVATVIHNDKLHWISCGDSGIFLFRNNEFTQLNQPHTFATDLDDQVANGVIPRDLAQAHPERESLTSFLGLEKLSLLDRSLRPITLRDGDTILLASDGLFKTLSYEAMTPLMDNDPQMLCETLVARTLAVQKPHQDNITVLAIGAERERKSVANTPLRDAVGIPQRQQSKLALLLVLAGVLAVAAYFFYMFAYRTPAVGNSPAVAAPPQPGRPGDTFDPAAAPRQDRQAGDNPEPPPAAAPEKNEPVQGKAQEGVKR